MTEQVKQAFLKSFDLVKSGPPRREANELMDFIQNGGNKEHMSDEGYLKDVIAKAEELGISDEEFLASWMNVVANVGPTV
jgi:hypothetical protein